MLGRMDTVMRRASWWLYARGLHPAMTGGERARIRLFRSFVRKGDLCFDIGANMGNRTEALVALGARVVAVEPQHQCAEYLRVRFQNHPRVRVVESAMGRCEGTAVLMTSAQHTLATLSHEWMDAVRGSGRFCNTTWPGREKVPVTTLDSLIAIHGCPTFCKIDVEGYEAEVVAGLSHPIKTLSFEFAPEFVSNTLQVIDHLSAIGECRFNWSLGETMRLEWTKWQDSVAIRQALLGLQDKTVFGDVYVRYPARNDTEGRA